MSQSDYLKHKKTAHILKENKLPPILNGNDYVSYTRFQITNTVENVGETNYGELIPPGKKKIFGMELNVSNCPSFILCSNTDTRSNRELLKGIYSDPKPYRPVYVKQPVTAKTSCKCKKNSKYTNDNIACCNSLH
jgi:hypothetical protein